MHEGLLYNRLINHQDFIVVHHANMCFTPTMGYRKRSSSQTNNFDLHRFNQRAHIKPVITTYIKRGENF